MVHFKMYTMFGKMKMTTQMNDKKFSIVYKPKVEDPVTVARFKTREEAEQHMDMIKVNHTTVYPFHKIVEIK
jgi:uncharacterized protein (UPF0248 family)